MLCREFRPEPPNSEATFTNVCIVEYDHTALGKAPTPCLVILPAGLVIVLAVNVKQIHRASIEISASVLKPGPQQGRKATELGFVEGSDVGEYFFTVEPSVFVT